MVDPFTHSCAYSAEYATGRFAHICYVAVGILQRDTCTVQLIILWADFISIIMRRSSSAEASKGINVASLRVDLTGPVLGNGQRQQGRGLHSSQRLVIKPCHYL